MNNDLLTTIISVLLIIIMLFMLYAVLRKQKKARESWATREINITRIGSDIKRRHQVRQKGQLSSLIKHVYPDGRSEHFVVESSYDTIGIFFAITLDNEPDVINRFFKEDVLSSAGWKEIGRKEYLKRLNRQTEKEIQ